MINNLNNKPLLLVGSRIPLGKIKRVCNQHNITIAGIVDSDYYNNRDIFEGISVIDSEQNLIKYKNDFNFFIATGWSPDKNHIRDKEKRKSLINLLEKHSITCINLIDKNSVVDATVKLGQGIFIDCFCLVEEGVELGDYVEMYNHAGVGHHSKIGTNTILQGKSGVTSYVTIADHCYLGICSSIMRSHTKIMPGTIVHPGLNVHRNSTCNETISLIGKDLRKIYSYNEIT